MPRPSKKKLQSRQNGKKNGERIEKERRIRELEEELERESRVREAEEERRAAATAARQEISDPVYVLSSDDEADLSDDDWSECECDDEVVCQWCEAPTKSCSEETCEGTCTTGCARCEAIVAETNRMMNAFDIIVEGQQVQCMCVRPCLLYAYSST